jgi:hypothetical protein
MPVAGGPVDLDLGLSAIKISLDLDLGGTSLYGLFSIAFLSCGIFGIEISFHGTALACLLLLISPHGP